MTSSRALALVPAPDHLSPTAEDDADVVLPAAPRVRIAPELTGARVLLRDVLGVRLGLDLVGSDGTDADVVLRHDAALDPEGYRLTVATTGTAVAIEAATALGAIHAIRTLQQLVGPRAYRTTPIDDAPVVLPAVVVQDAPRLGHRGLLLDVARHYLPKEQVLRYVELASQHKLNVLHLHLTDDQGWRLPVPGYPRLAEVAAWRHASPVDAVRGGPVDGEPHGGWYTADDLREIVAFARGRGVTVVPEVDLPGHVQALLAAYPELAPGGAPAEPLEVWTRWGLNPHVLGVHEAALDFARAALDQLVDIFDSELICIGGDEVDTRDWAADADTRALAAELGLDGVDALLPWFSTQLAEHLAANGRRTSVWDEVSGEGLPRDVVITVWRAATSAVEAIAGGHDVILCPESVLYLDHRAGLGEEEPVPVGGLHTIEDVYRYDPASPDVVAATGLPGAGRLLGAQAQVWREYLPDSRRTDYATFPRLAAAAESFWSHRRDWTDFESRLAAHLGRLDAAGVEYRPLDGPLPWQRRPALRGRVIGEP